MPKAFTSEDFLSCVEAVNKNNYVYGNDVLYRAFDLRVLPHPSVSKPGVGELSSALWVIGKAYSADPTRSASTTLIASSGLGLSFHTIALGIVGHSEYKTFYKKLVGLKDKKYTFVWEQDKAIVQECIACLDMLNSMIKDVMGSGSHNVVSFCSKFLHFMCPDVFFIIDSLSLAGGITLYSGWGTRVFEAEMIPAADWLEIADAAREYFKAESAYQSIGVSDIACSDDAKVYRMHCRRAYAFAVYLNKNGQVCAPQIKGIGASSYMPRLVDSVLMRIK